MILSYLGCQPICVFEFAIMGAQQESERPQTLMGRTLLVAYVSEPPQKPYLKGQSSGLQDTGI